MTGARKRKHVLWQAAGADDMMHGYVEGGPDRNDPQRRRRVAERSLCGLPRPAKPVRTKERCHVCQISMGQTW